MRNPLAAIAVFLGLAIFAGPALAGSCAKPTQFEITECTAADARAADAELGTVYSKLLAQVGTPEKADLRAAERAWVSFKTATCDFVGLSRAGGSMQGQVINQCLASMARDQTARLQWQIDHRDSGEIGPK